MEVRTSSTSPPSRRSWPSTTSSASARRPSSHLRRPVRFLQVPPRPPGNPQAYLSRMPPGPSRPKGEAPSAAAAVAARLSAYDVELPEDYCGVSFDMIKRPEANLIMGEAVLAVIDGSTLDASPYKADRGKVHWRRKLFEETFLRFEANPPRPKSAPEQEQAEVQDREQPQEEVEEREPADAVADETSPTATDRVDLAPALEPAAASSGNPTQAPVASPAPVLAAAAVQASEITSPATPTPQHPEPTSSRGEAENPSTPVPTVVAPEIRPSASVGQAAPAGDGRSGMPAFDQAQPVPASGQIIEFPGAPNAHQDAVDADDILDPFESALPSRPAMADAGPQVHARDVGSDEADETAGDPAGGDDETPTYDGPEWEGPSEEAEADLDRTMDDRIHYDPREHDPAVAGAMRTGGLDPAAAAALAEAAAPPVVEEREASRLPVGGVPPRPPIPMPTVRPAPAVPPRPAVAPPGSAGTSAPRRGRRCPAPARAVGWLRGRSPSGRRDCRIGGWSSGCRGVVRGGRVELLQELVQLRRNGALRGLVAVAQSGPDASGRHDSQLGALIHLGAVRHLLFRPGHRISSEPSMQPQ